MFASLHKAVGTLFDRSLSGMFWTAVLITLVLFGALIAGVEYAVHQLPTLGAPWVNTLLAYLAPVLGIVLIFALGAPVAAFFASFFLERYASAIEQRYYPADAKPSGAPFGTMLFTGLRLAVLILLVDLLLLPLEEVTLGLADVAVIFLNGWLLGREYFELVALRHMSRSAADALRRRHGGSVLVAGVTMSILSAVPVADVFAPLFGVALMVHIFKYFSHQERPV